jgi:hypothetical protein
MKVYFYDNINLDSDGGFIERFYYLNEILIFALFFRMGLIFKISLKFTKYYSSQVGRIWFVN